MTNIEIAELALRGIVILETGSGADSYHLSQCLRLVVGGYLSGNLSAVQSGLEADGHARGFAPAYQKDVNDMKARGLHRMPDPRIAEFRRELHAAKKASA